MILSKNNKKSTIKIYFIFFLDINKNYYIIHSITFLTFLTFIKMHDKKCEMKLYWTTTIWPKWQLVIPKEVRELLWLNTWDSITVVVKDDRFIGLVRNNDLTELMEFVKLESK